MYRKTRIGEILKHIEAIDSHNLELTDDYLSKMDEAPTSSKSTLLGELVDFLNSIKVKHKIDKNLNIIIEK